MHTRLTAPCLLRDACRRPPARQNSGAKAQSRSLPVNSIPCKFFQTPAGYLDSRRVHLPLPSFFRPGVACRPLRLEFNG
jgi:hypothetical protein